MGYGTVSEDLLQLIETLVERALAEGVNCEDVVDQIKHDFEALA